MTDRTCMNETRRAAYILDAARIVHDIRIYEDTHPADAPCLGAALATLVDHPERPDAPVGGGQRDNE